MLKAGLTAGVLLASLSVAAMAQDKTVVVYTAHKASIVDALVPKFEKETGIKVDVVKAGSGDIIKRVKAESSAPKADVIWSIGGEQLEDNKDLLQTYTPKDDAALLQTYKVSPEWIPYTGILLVMAVNNKELKPADYPKTWAELGDAKWKGKVSSARADSSGSSFQQLATVLIAYGDKGWDVYNKTLANMNLSDSSGAVPRYVNDGEALVGLTLEDNALDYVKGGGNVAIVYPEDGSSTVADGVALVKGAPHAETGKVFIDWLLSKPVQEQLVSDIGRRSVRKDVTGAGLKPISEIKLVDYDIKKVAQHRNEWIAKWKAALQNR
ncbi:extracellular solute-binding protein [Microvirga sp. 17 mud 1-3]|uniref:extracellular solute-binding protein n=1 Tax=Microvirga sp. 17 mud 1-3 TaxID=2082949 RepID=UPI000D6C0E47|nr:extracellular solute-binding protein [Microvirga sp. 17 mud 1-3]AWM88532.1 ABC transporter substrate-binding protein [Microvirga sp. 17 mud 1-3]